MKLRRYLFDMKIKELGNMINQILEEQTKILISEDQGMEDEGKKLIFDTIKGFQTLSNLVDKISNIQDISDETHEFGVSIEINDISEEEMLSACGGSNLEESQKKLMQGLHLDLEEKGLGQNFDIDVDISGNEGVMDLKINIVSEDTEKLGTEMSENTNEPMEGNAFVAALSKAREAGEDTFTVDGETHNVEECWKQLEEEEMMGDEESIEEESIEEKEECNECQGPVNEDFDMSAIADAESHFQSLVGQGTEETDMAEGNHEGGHDEVCEECGSGLMSEGECMECGYNGMNESKQPKSFKLTESKLVDMISKIVMESIPGLDAVKTAHSQDKGTKEYLSSVDKKLKDYLSFDGNDNPEFPKQIGKGEKVASKNTEEEDEFVEDNRGGGMQHLEYDEKPSTEFVERLKKSLSGDSTTGNKQDGDDVANVIPSDLGKEMVKQIERKHKKDEKAPMYVKDPAPVQNVKSTEAKTISEGEEKTKSEILAEMKRMKDMLSYNEKTQ